MHILIAGRGEIAVRVARGARESGHTTVAVYTDPDRGAPHVVACDAALPIGDARGYLDVTRLLEAARTSGAAAVHPGYGFLSENAGFAQAVTDAGLVWIGPPPSAIAVMGDKLAARRAMVAAGVPVIPGVENGNPVSIAALGFPVMIKAAHGGGGKGMRIARNPQQLEDALTDSASEANRSFGHGAVYAERLLERSRHVEVQILADAHGHVMHLGERECSIQRRNQKIVEEAPCIALADGTRAALCAAAVCAAEAVGYRSAGTVEFLVAETGEFYFLEMNTRIQVEHPVTELVWGVDIVFEQLRIALGQPLSCLDAHPRGHAIECRVYAEDPETGFSPSPGTVRRLREPSGPGIRNDLGVLCGAEIPLDYDPLISKVIVQAPTRTLAIERMRRALGEYEIAGVATTIEFLRDVLAHPAFVAADTPTDFLARHFAEWSPSRETDAALIAAWAIARLTPTAAGTANAKQPSPWTALGAWGRS